MSRPHLKKQVLGLILRGWATARSVLSRENQGTINKNGLKKTNEEKKKSDDGSWRERDGEGQRASGLYLVGM